MLCSRIRNHEADQLAKRLAKLEPRDIALRDPPLPGRVLAHAVAVADRHGVGQRALSNFDCFHYAYAKTAGEPLLTLDRLLRSTDAETKP